MVFTRFSVPALLVASLVSPAIAASESTAFEFSTCGASGRTGPSQTQCNNAYQGTSLENKVEVVGEGIQEWTVPEDGTYRITVAGAASGNGGSGRASGAIVGGEIKLKKDQRIDILVGQQGSASEPTYVSGGGGSFFVNESQDPIFVAGGAGGVAGDGWIWNPKDARGMTATYGGDGSENERDKECPPNNRRCYEGGKDGNGGMFGAASGGAGFYGQSNEPGPNSLDPGSPQPYVSGGEGGIYDNAGPGPFGAGGTQGNHGGGGGGGYSGGGGCYHYGCIGGGGGSFISKNAKDVITSDGTWNTTGTEPDPVYTGDPESLNNFNSGPGYVKVKLVQGSGPGFCNFRGPRNQCISNQTNFLSQSSFDVSSALLVEPSAVFQSSLPQPLINVSNSTRLSGEWRGGFEVSSSSSPVIGAGASFEPGEEDIVIGK